MTEHRNHRFKDEDERHQFTLAKHRLAEMIPALEELQGEFADEVLRSVQRTRLWKIEAPKWADKTRLVVDRPVIHPQLIPEEEAPRLGVDYLNLMTFQQDLAPMYASRMPGVMQVSEAAIELAMAINQRKSEIKQWVTSVSAGRRIDLCHELPGCQSVKLTYLYRHIPLLPEDTMQVAFAWETQDTIIDTLTVDEAVHFVEESRPLEVSENHDEITRLIKQNILSAAKPVKYRRQQPPKPGARLKVDGSPSWKRRLANLPFLTSDTFPAIKDLPDYDKAVDQGKERIPRGDQRQYVQISPKYPLYWVNES